tara:strand:- start:97 stop:324 length:228 start_codon:yes stop_codon:yes gene_type:complete
MADIEKALVPAGNCTIDHEIDLWYLRRDLRKLRVSVNNGEVTAKQIKEELNSCLEKLGEENFRCVTEDEAWSMER